MDKLRQAKKITIRTVESFVDRNRGHLWANVKSDFDGMTDAMETRTAGWEPARQATTNLDATMGVDQAWFVRGSRDRFSLYDKDGFFGVEVWNSCGHFILAVKK